MMQPEDCPTTEDSPDLTRCRRARPDGTWLEFGTLHFDPEQREFRIQPAGAEIIEEWYPTLSHAREALYEAHIEALCRRADVLSEQLRGVREDLALLGGLR